MKEIVVQKYGGSSIASLVRIEKVAGYIKKIAESKNVVVVVSAMGDETDRLKTLAKEISSNPDPAELDKLISTGENQSAALLTMALLKLGQKAVSLSGFHIGLTTDFNHGNARVKEIQNIGRIQKLLEQNKVVVIAGFQGVVDGSDELVTLGRGGSDLTAIALSAALKTGECEIYTDVDGVYAIDPRIIPQAKRYERITYSQMIQLAGAGSGVLMARSVILAQNLGVRIKTLLSPSIGESSGGTLVYSGSSLQEMERGFSDLPGIAVQNNLRLIKISNIPNKPGALAEILKPISGINILQSVQGGGEEKADVSFLYQKEDLTEVIPKLNELRKKGIKVESDKEVVELTLVDPTAKDRPGYFYRISKALAKAGINIEMFAAAGVEMMVVIRQEDLHNAAKTLAEEFKSLESSIC
ncbi:MAG: aspartate kinase [Candidatus Nealsonbacteria bacterium]|nr:aspartate kinase [Candidatus Nealsonbacteria bacterium]